MKTREIPLADLDLDPAFQHRAAGLDAVKVAEYAAHRAAGGRWKDAPVVFSDRSAGKLWLPGGFHRYAAERQAGNDSMLCEVRDGDELDAFIYSLAENSDHGAPRTNADKRQAVNDAIDRGQRDRLGWSASQIARLCKVTQPFVSKLLQEREESKTVIGSDRKGPQSPPPAGPGGGGAAAPPAAGGPDPELAEEEGAELAEELAEEEERSRRRGRELREKRRTDASNFHYGLVRELTALGLIDRHRAALDLIAADLRA